jgi:hypothetical protein
MTEAKLEALITNGEFRIEHGLEPALDQELPVGRLRQRFARERAGLERTRPATTARHAQPCSTDQKPNDGLRHPPVTRFVQLRGSLHHELHLLNTESARCRIQVQRRLRVPDHLERVLG